MTFITFLVQAFSAALHPLWGLKSKETGMLQIYHTTMRYALGLINFFLDFFYNSVARLLVGVIFEIFL